MKIRILTLFFVPTLLFSELKTVSEFDLKRYMGTWYEIALLPNRFQKRCIQGAVVHYSLRKDGSVNVVNTCLTSSGSTSVNGIAWIPDNESRAKLKVSFLPFFKYLHWFGGDYWILYLDPDYQYALVGEPEKRYLWLLGRKSTVDDKTYTQLLEIAREKGYDISLVIRRR